MLARWSALALLATSSLTHAADLQTLPAGRWYRFPDSKLEAVAPKEEVSGTIKSVMAAWSGGVYDTDRDQLVVWGGGHKDYAGNEVYAFGPLSSPAPKWRRLTEPSLPAADNTARGKDGRPVSRHTYNLLTYLPAPYNKMMSCGIGSRHSDGYGAAGVDFYDFSVDGLQGQPWSVGPDAPSNSYATSAFCVYNPATQQVWYQDMGASNSQLQRFDVAKNRWSTHVKFNPDSEPTAAIDPRRNWLVSTGQRNGTRLYDLNKPDREPLKLATEGPRAVEEGKFPGFVHDPVNDQFVGWSGGAQVYGLAIPRDAKRGPWVWAPIPLDPGNDVVPTELAGKRMAGYVTGTFGRFRYVPSLHGVVLVNGTDEDVYFFKLPKPSTAALRGVLRALSPLGTAEAAETAADALPTVKLQNLARAKQSDVPFTFGQVFKAGAVPKGSSVVARLGDGTAVPLQVDAKATHADGSLRHAVLSGRVAMLPARGDQVLTLSLGPRAAGEPIALSELLASGYDTSVTLNVGGTIYTASARQALAAPKLKTWLSGPIVSEWLAMMPVRNASGANHPHLTAYFHVRAYAGMKQVRTDVVIENNWAFVPKPGNFEYTVKINVPDQPQYSNAMTHYSAARWHKRLWWGSDPQVYAKLDKTYLQDTKAIPKYEDVQPSERFLNSVRRSTEPMNNGDHTPNMDETGYQPGIGPLPQWDAVYAVSTDVRALDYMLANADGGGAYSIHLRDEKTGLPISIDDYPNTSLVDPESSKPVIPTGPRSIYFEGQWSSHQPSIGFLPYVVTGDYYYLEEMQFWSAYNLIWTNAEYRNRERGWFYTGSIRGQAWAYRSLAQAAYITPDAHPYKAYLLDKLRHNIGRDTYLYVTPGGPHKNNLGAMYSYDGNDTYLFFDYFMSWTVQYLVDLGFTEAVPFRDYKMKWPIGIMGNGPDEFCFQAAPQFKWQAGPSGTSTFYPDFKTVFAKTVPGADPARCGTSAMSDFLSKKFEVKVAGPNGTVGDQTSTTYWYAQMQAALAAAYDSGVPGGKQAWERGQASKVHPDFKDNPIWAVVPRSLR